MSYTKQTWANGDVVTAAKLNHMEDGIEAGGSGGGGGALVVTSTDGTCNKTAAEMFAAAQTGLVIIHDTNSDIYNTVVSFQIDRGYYSFVILSGSGTTNYGAAGATEYPVDQS